MSSGDDPPKLLDEERRCIDDARRGDRQAFAALVERYWDRLYRWLYRLTRDRHLAEDLTQEAFLKALAHLETFRAGSNFQAWLFRIAHNSWVNHARRPGHGPHGHEPHVFPEHLPGRDEGPLETVVSRECLQLLARAVGRLPAEFRAAFLLRAEEGLSFRQIGEVLGLTEETARWRVFKARQKLLSALAPQLEHEDR